nr:MAG TPA_asm: hypothetical protein [Caudoviricetes sp.]
MSDSQKTLWFLSISKLHSYFDHQLHTSFQFLFCSYFLFVLIIDCTPVCTRSRQIFADLLQSISPFTLIGACLGFLRNPSPFCQFYLGGCFTGRLFSFLCNFRFSILRQRDGVFYISDLIFLSVIKGRYSEMPVNVCSRNDQMHHRILFKQSTQFFNILIWFLRLTFTEVIVHMRKEAVQSNLIQRTDSEEVNVPEVMYGHCGIVLCCRNLKGFRQHR